MQPGKPKEAQGKEKPKPDPTPTAAAALALKRGCWEVLGSPSLTELLVSSPTVSPSISRTVPGQMLSGPSMQKSAPSLFVFFFFWALATLNALGFLLFFWCNRDFQAAE